MQRTLRKRILRDLSSNALRYLALSFMIILSLYLVISIVAAADTLILGTRRSDQEHRIEDGQFTVFVPLTTAEESSLTDAGVSLERTFYLDFELEDDSILRIFAVRDTIDLIALDAGRLPEADGEIVLEKRYCEEHDLAVGDTIAFGGNVFSITGIGSSPDYNTPYRNLGDSAVDSESFGPAFVSRSTYAALLKGGRSIQSEEYVYAYRLNGSMTDQALKDRLEGFTIDPDDVDDEYFQDYWDQLLRRALGSSNQLVVDMAQLFFPDTVDLDLGVLTTLLPAGDNMRIDGAADDQVINRLGGLIAGVIILILFTYVISVFVIHSIEEESAVIGTLYALGVRRNELIRHYLLLPVLVTFVSGVIGTALGYSRLGVPVQTADCYAYYSIPALDTIYEPYLVLYGTVLPPMIAAAVNWFVIRRRLNRPALQLMRNEQKQNAVSDIDLGNMGFIRRFRIRQMLRELRSGLTIWFGMLVTLLLVMMGLDCYYLCDHLQADYAADTRFEYMYLYKYPDETVPEGGVGAYARTLKREIYGYNLDVTVLGLPEDQPYFDASPSRSMTSVQISTAMAQKYGLAAGNRIILTDEEDDRDYAFTVDSLVNYAPGMYVFMDIDSMRELFGADDNYYNIVFSSEALDIPSGRLYSVTSRAALAKSVSVWVSLLAPMEITMISASALIFVLVMYLMMKVMIDRSAYSISLMLVFGYRRREIRRLYLDGNFYFVALGAAVCLPLSKLIIDKLYPLMISNIACGMDLHFPLYMYACLYAAILALYFLINRLLTGYIGRIVPAEVLKNRE